MAKLSGRLHKIQWSNPYTDPPAGAPRVLAEVFTLGKNAPVGFSELRTAGALMYIAMSAQEWPVIDKALRDQGFHWSSTIVWAKDQLVLSRKDYHTQFEPLWYGWRDDAARLREVMDRKQSDVWFIDRPKRSEDHPTMKPPPLVKRSLVNSSLPGDIVLDPFVGSGTTLIVCEQLTRKCRAVELDPIYAAVTIERWAELTGMLPVQTP